MNASYYRIVWGEDKDPRKCIHGFKLGTRQACPHCGLKAGLPRLQWGDMGSAPQGAAVIVHADGDVGEAINYGDGWQWSGGGRIEPDGWMPLPPVPKEATRPVLDR